SLEQRLDRFLGWLRLGFRLRLALDDLVVLLDLGGALPLRLGTSGRLVKTVVDLQLVESFEDARGGTREQKLDRRHLTRARGLTVDFEQARTLFATGAFDLIVERLNIEHRTIAVNLAQDGDLGGRHAVFLDGLAMISAERERDICSL